MPLNFTREPLSDGKMAVRIDGLPDSPVWVRIEKVEEKTVGEDAAGAVDRVMKVRAVRVNADGSPFLDAGGRPVASPAVTRSVNMAAVMDGSLALADERQALRQQAINGFLRLHLTASDPMSDDLS